MCNVVGASIAYKIVKIDNIALQCNSLKVKTIIKGDRVNRNGDGINAIVLRNQRTVGTMSQGSGDQYSLRSPAQPCWSAE